MKKQPLQHGKIEIGCNYWASHAGMYMWRDWREDVVERDFAKLSELGITMLRVFPLWPDFQPVTQLRGCFGDGVGYGDASGQPLPPGDVGAGGLTGGWIPPKPGSTGRAASQAS